MALRLAGWRLGLVSGAIACAALAAVLVPGARAELPPGSYDSLRVEAPEALVIEVTEVKLTDGKPGMTEVVAQAKVLTAERSKAGLKKGDTLTIQYTAVDPSKLEGWVGPRSVPVLVKGNVYPAFLKPTEDGKAYEPAAYGESFTMTPER